MADAELAIQVCVGLIVVLVPAVFYLMSRKRGTSATSTIGCTCRAAVAFDLVRRIVETVDAPAQYTGSHAHAYEEGCESQERLVMEQLRAHWFTQGGELIYGRIGEPQNADEFIAAVLSVLRNPRPPTDSEWKHGS